MTSQPSGDTANLTDEFVDLVNRDVDGLLSDDERDQLWRDENLADIRLVLIEAVGVMNDATRDGDVEIAHYHSRCIREGAVGKSKYFHAKNEWASRRAEIVSRRVRAQEMITEAKDRLARYKRAQMTSVSPVSAEERRRRGEEINARLDRIESMLERLSARLLAT